MRQRGLAVLSGRSWGGARTLMPLGGGDGDEEGADVTLWLRGDADDGGRVLDALRTLDRALERAGPRGERGAVEPVLFLLSYEACVALDPRLPRKARGAPGAGAEPGAAPDVVVRRCRAAAPALRGAGASPPPRPRVGPPDEAAHARHLARVRAAHEHLLDGVIYQANLAHRLTVEPASFAEGLDFFLEETAAAPPPCAAFVDLPGWGSLVSLSPERFLVADFGARAARAYPIKGTRPRGATADEDARLLAELCASEKDAAEHVMIVDLLRNDLGKCAIPGGVTVERLLEVMSVANVHHLESTVAARLRPDVRPSDLLVATVPGGSITGAPKSSAVEVIHDLEDGARGLYTGVLGLLDGGRLASSLLIRSWLRADDGPGALHVGGGIVVDSEPEAEWRETLEKARAFGALAERPR
jgi:para-aminobenzoate synthetase component I